MKFKKITKLVLFGGSPVLLDFAQIASARDKYKIFVFSAKRHLEEKLPFEKKTLKKALQSLVRRVYKSDDINHNKKLVQLVDGKTLGVAFGASWTFSKKTVDLFNKNHLLDFMGIDLPRYRGGAHYSWQIMHGNRASVLNMQMVFGGTSEFHRGPVIFRNTYQNPRLAKPLDYFLTNSKHQIDFFRRFLKAVENGVEFKIVKINESKSSHYPFLSTKMNGYINWSWNGKDIYLFINAFDDPYMGAKTFLGNKKVILKACLQQKQEENYHPFTSGIVVRVEKNYIYVATVGSLLKIGKVMDENNNSISVKLGDRFYTPYKHLDQSLQFRAVYDSKGLVKNNRK